MTEEVRRADTLAALKVSALDRPTTMRGDLPTFFFHVRTPNGLEWNEIGIPLPDVETAYLEACAAIPDISAEFMAQHINPIVCSFVIAGEGGQTLMEVPFNETLRGERRPARPDQHTRARHLCLEIADLILEARETARQSRAILARARAVW